MSGIITRGEIPKLLWPGISQVFFDVYKEHPEEYKKLFETRKSDKAYEEDVTLSGTGYAPVKKEGANTEYDDMKQFYVSRYTNVTYALGFIITEESVEDNLYVDLGSKGAGELAQSFNQTRELVGHDLFNDGFTGGPTFGDGQTFFSDAHPLQGGAGTFSNVLTPGADMSEAALEDILNQLEGAVNNRGLKIALEAKSLHIPYQLQFDTKRILGDSERPGTANRDINAMYHMGMFPEGFFVHHYFDDPDAFFVKTTARDAVKYYNRIEADFTDDNTFDTGNLKYKVRGRYSFGISDPRGFFASPGAA